MNNPQREVKRTLKQQYVGNGHIGRCPCGCGSVIELLLIKDATPHWSYIVDKNNRPSLYPSVWLKTGCESHFWLKNGRIYWA
nr:DUF6527 family protein [Cronobacter muytjensii]